MKRVARFLTAARCLPILAAGLLALGGCGGGGGGSASGTPTVVTGTVSMGLIKNGSVSIFKLDANGAKVGLALKTVPTDSNGKYSADISPYIGPILIEASGTYVDESSTAVPPLQITIDPLSPIRAMCSNASGTVSVAVTALTDIAVRQVAASPGATIKDKIDAANTAVSDAFHVDIINVQPVEPTAAAMFNGTTTQAQRDYTLALAALSQMGGGGAPATTMASVASDMSGNGGALSSGEVTTIQTALTDYLGSAGSSLGNPATNLGKLGYKSILLHLTASGAVKMAGAAVTLTIPSDATVSNDFIVSNGLTTIIADSLYLGSAAPVSGFLLGSFDDATHTIKVSQGGTTAFTPGEFAVLKVYYPATKTYTTADFTITAQKVVDLNSNTIADTVSIL